MLNYGIGVSSYLILQVGCIFCSISLRFRLNTLKFLTFINFFAEIIPNKSTTED